jgi:hypothetical protein
MQSSTFRENDHFQKDGVARDEGREAQKRVPPSLFKQAWNAEYLERLAFSDEFGKFLDDLIREGEATGEAKAFTPSDTPSESRSNSGRSWCRQGAVSHLGDAAVAAVSLPLKQSASPSAQPIDLLLSLFGISVLSRRLLEAWPTLLRRSVSSLRSRA